jgi:hypothetical protein
MARPEPRPAQNEDKEKPVPTNTTRARAVACAVTLLVAAGCAEPAGPPAPAAAPAAAAAAERGRPARELTPREDRQLFVAEETLVSRCMAGKGLTYAVSVPPGNSPPKTAPPEPWYGLDDVASARARGYGLGQRRPPSSPATAAPDNDPNARLLARMSPARQQAYTEALYGDPAQRITEPLGGGATLFLSVTGCVADARRQLYGDVRAFLHAEFLVVNIRRAADRVVRADPGYQQALGRWRACMRRSGHAYDEPAAARAAMADRRDRAMERAVAVADATCARQARLVATAKRGYQDALTAQTRKLDAEIRAYRAARVQGLRVARAAGLLRPGRPGAA